MSPRRPPPRALPIAGVVLLVVLVSAALVTIGREDRSPFGPPAKPELGLAGAAPEASAPNAPPPPAERPQAGEPDVPIAELGEPGETVRLGRPPEPVLPTAEPSPAAPAEVAPPPDDPGEAEEPSFAEPPRLIALDPPRYPPAARRARREATVRIHVRVDRRGRVVEASTVGEPAGLGFDEAAREAARRARFEPARLGGRPVRGETYITVRFRLDE